MIAPRYDALFMNDLAALDDADHELGNIHVDIKVAQVFRHPPPLFHVGDQLRFADVVDLIERAPQPRRYRRGGRPDLLALLVRPDCAREGIVVVGVVRGRAIRLDGRRGDFQKLADKCDLRVAFARHNVGPVRDRQAFPFFCRSAQSDEFLAQKLELRLLWMQRLEIGAFVLRRGQPIDKRPAVEEHRLTVEIGRKLLRRIADPAAMCVARVFHGRERQLDLGGRQVILTDVTCNARLQIGNFVVGRVETPIVGILEGRNEILRVVIVAVLRHPERRTHAAGVELLHGFTICLVEVAESPAVDLEVASGGEVEQIACRHDRRSWCCV